MDFANDKKVNLIFLDDYKCVDEFKAPTFFIEAVPDFEKVLQLDLGPKTIENFKNTSLLDIRLHTGRFHQIRAQLSFIGYPIVGDKKYGASSVLPEGRIALHAQKIVFNHPTSKEEIIINCRLPEDWPVI